MLGLLVAKLLTVGIGLLVFWYVARKNLGGQRPGVALDLLLLAGVVVTLVGLYFGLIFFAFITQG